MGRLGCDTTINHFSHPHPLHLSSPDQHQSSLTPISCAACALPSASWTYSCTPCSFHLHLPCANLPPLIHHPSHQTHSLSLLPHPAYPEGHFDCDACARTGTAFSYHCSACGVDLHTACASMPLSVNHYAHPHPLTLAFFPPYDNKGFSCDVCGRLGGNHWLYRCALCEFDVHLGCGAGAGAGPRAGTVISRSVSQGSVVGRGRPQMQMQMQQQQGVSRMGSTGGLMRQIVNGLVDGATQQIGQNLVNGFSGGGGDAGGGGGGVGVGGGGGGSSIMDVGSAILGSVLGGGSSGDSS